MNDLLTKFCLAIQHFEGYYPPDEQYPYGTASYRNCNPGNLKYSQYTESLGAIAKSPAGFAIFSNYEDGFAALCQFVSDAAHNELKAYQNCTIDSFFFIYAPPADNNPTNTYAQYVAAYVGLPLDTPISSLGKVENS